MCEILRESDLYEELMDPQKAYDKINRDALWNILQIYRINGKIVNAVWSF